MRLALSLLLALAPCGHGPRYCHAHAERHAIRVVHHQALLEARRCHCHVRPMRLSWRKLALDREQRFWRGELVVLRRTPAPDPAPSDVLGGIAEAAAEHGLSAAGMTRVAECESTLNRFATNGQYLGLFQLGDYARARYLYGAWSNALENARAAARYARAAGGFGPWTCGYAY